jgi:NAD(P)-dependent dehydrogenase (short-subunit alcohol dehydrogenase family)
MSVLSKFDLSDKVAVITGGSRGMGREIVRAYAEQGADVVIASRNVEACEALAEEIRRNTGRRALAVACHVGRWQDCDALIADTVREFGRLDILVNNAGVSPLYESLAGITEELYDKTLAVNLKGPFRLAVLAATYMAEHDGGSIINVGTIGSLLASVDELPYACAKAGLNSLTAGLAEAFAPQVRVNSILPGAFATDISKAWPQELRAGVGIPLGRVAEPAEIVGAALYLASDAASYTTGASIRVDGGVTRKVGG